MARLPKEDQEVLISMDMTDTTKWKVYTSNPAWIRKLSKIAEPYHENEWGSFFELESSQIRFYKSMTQRQKEQASRLAKKNVLEHGFKSAST